MSMAASLRNHESAQVRTGDGEKSSDGVGDFDSVNASARYSLFRTKLPHNYLQFDVTWQTA
jgi:hypothetical protein